MFHSFRNNGTQWAERVSIPTGAGALSRRRLRDSIAPARYHGAGCDVTTLLDSNRICLSRILCETQSPQYTPLVEHRY